VPCMIVVTEMIFRSLRGGSETQRLCRWPPVIGSARGGELDVAGRCQIAAFEVAGLELAPLPQGCDRECLLERVGGEAKLVANELAQALTLKLSGFILPARGANAAGGPAPLSGGVVALVPVGDAQGCLNLPTAFVIRFNGFSTSEIEAIEEYLAGLRLLPSPSAYSIHSLPSGILV
jgi:hypothetical protein